MGWIVMALVIGSAALAGVASPAEAQTTRWRFGDTWPTAELTPSQRAFAAAYVPAVTGRDIRQYERLIHPASLACRRKDNEDFFHDLFTRHQGLSAHGPVTIESLPPKLDFFDLAAKQGLGFPVRPTHAFYVELVSPSGVQRSVVAFAAPAGGSWYQVVPCPTPEAVAAYRAKKAQTASEEATARELARSLPDSVRAQVVALLRDGKRVAATKKYAELSGQSLAVARRVVELLESQRR